MTAPTLNLDELFPSQVRTSDVSGLPGLGQDAGAQKLAQIFANLNYAPVQDNSNQLAAILKQGSGLAGPTPYDSQIAANQGTAADLAVQDKFLRGNPVPQMPTDDFTPLPTRTNVPLPARGNDTHEQASSLAAGLISLLGGSRGVNVSDAIPQTINRGRQLDERDYNDAVNNYQRAVEQSNTQYADALNSRNALVNWQQNKDNTDYGNAMGQYNQGLQTANVEGKQAGLTTQTAGLQQLQQQATAYAQGKASLEGQLQLLQYQATTDAQKRGEFGAVLGMYQKAIELQQQGDLTNANIALAQAHTLAAQAQTASTVAETDRQTKLLPGQMQAQGDAHTHSSAELQNMAAQRGLYGAEAGAANARANASNAEAAKTRQDTTSEQTDGGLNLAHQRVAIAQQHLAMQEYDRILKPIEQQLAQVTKARDGIIKEQDKLKTSAQPGDPTFAAKMNMLRQRGDDYNKQVADLTARHAQMLSDIQSKLNPSQLLNPAASNGAKAAKNAASGQPVYSGPGFSIIQK